MAQVAVKSVPHEPLSPSKVKKDPFFSSGRGGSGNIRRLPTSPNAERFADLPDPPLREHQGTSTAGKKQFTSSGRGGSGNVQPSTSSLEAHPLTASILSQHGVMQAQYEQRVRKVHAESNVVRSSGRGGSGNISNPRQRSRSQEPKTIQKRHFFTRKGRERSTTLADGVMQAHDGQERSDMDKRTSRFTCSSGSSWPLDASEESRVSHEVASSGDATTDPLPRGDATTAHFTKRLNFLTRKNKPPSSASSMALPGSPRSPPPTVSTYPRSSHTGSAGSHLSLHSSTSIVLEDREHVSFLEF